MKKGIAIAAFTEKGRQLAQRLQTGLGDRNCTIRGDAVPLKQWAEESFAEKEALLFIGASGIAVRTVAPFLKSKAEDPAVVVLDEAGRYVIPLVSVHLGGANELAVRIADLCGAVPVITTATDVNGAFAVDLWAKTQGLKVLQPERIRYVSGRILRGESITLYSPWEISGQLPEQVRFCGYSLQDVTHLEADPAGRECPVFPGEGDAVVTLRPWNTKALSLIPQAVVLGIGCRRGIQAETIERVFRTFCEERKICPESILKAASVDLKAEEKGLLDFCAAHGWTVRFYPAEELAAVPGTFRASTFVEKTTGVDNICERSAVRAAEDGILLEEKYAADGVTMAAAVVPQHLSWQRLPETE